ncbi:sacsin N-terminal ATP-binding-like domain-containing protein [Gillisia sp. Hel_I_29]|uniref:sacsin N-terminal ATP-binding-like domain-containing protein n=1 Tax=Gillisia sp. Hel_I_29 TaxID=1249975 RepID=UPI00055536F5|nr:DUF3883 domain-containing protein [Gillisia sp. Hel_I_29]
MSYKQKSREANFKQHSNKIFTAIREIEPPYAEKRAIWELFQNALDIVENTGVIRIKETDIGFKFEHNGRPFNDGNLTALIKQSSDGKKYGSNEEETGQYGTGFLSTHVYGKRILINGSVSIDGSLIKELKDFEIDRNADSPEMLSIKIQKQDLNAENICDEPGNELSEHKEFTSFEYIANKDSRNPIQNMFDYLPSILPFVFAFNSKLNRVEVENKNKKVIFQKSESSTSESLVLNINEEIHEFQLLNIESDGVKIILPQNELNFVDIPKMFLFYPLMKTADSGINFLIHAKELKPNKERDYLFLESSNLELKNDVDTNHTLLSKAFKLVIDKISLDDTVDFLPVIDIEFKKDEASFLYEKKLELVLALKDLKRIKVKDDFRSLKNISYLHEDILIQGVECLEDIYKVVSQFYEVPEFEDYIYLSERINNWQIEDFTIINYRQIFNEIGNQTNNNYSKVNFQKGYIFLVKLACNKPNLINEIKALPNIHNEFKTQGELTKWEIIEEPLIRTMDEINGAVSSSYLHPEFYFLEGVGNYSREDFKDDLNKFNNSFIIELEKSGDVWKTDFVKPHSLISTLTYYVGLNKTTKINKEFVDFFRSEFDLEIKNNDLIDKPTVDLQYDSSFKLLARLYIILLRAEGKEYIKDNLGKLESLVSTLYMSSELRKNLLDKLSCFPNQSYQLRSQNGLKLDHIKDEEFKTTYFNILKVEIRDQLLLPTFEKFIDHNNSISGLSIGSEIETKLNGKREFLPPPESHEEFQLLIKLIGNISKNGSRWGEWLPNISKVKEELLMSRFTSEKTRSSLFKILSGDDEKVNILGELSEISDLTAFINAGKEKQKEEARQKHHLIHINEIGLKIQDLIQDQLDSSLSETIKIAESRFDEELTTEEEQDGQDFIIYKSGSPIYYIEVKSRWDPRGIVALSKRQTECCASNKENYAVITVNVADYKSRNNVVDENISFDDLSEDVYVNTDLGDNFELLIKENKEFEAIKENTKLIDFRGHIPQERIKLTGISFENFIDHLKKIILQKKVYA